MKIDTSSSKQLAAEIQRIGKAARTEEDVRINVENALKPALSKLGIKTEPRYEQRLTLLHGTGYADAVYGFGVIEYERPRRLSMPAGRKEVVKQLSEYLTSKARELAPTKPVEAIKKMIGIGIDGEQIMYLRYASSENRAKFFQPVSLETQLEFFKQPGLKRGGFQIVGPMPVDDASVDWLLYSLQFFHRRALEPHSLAEVFGPDGNLASSTINAFHHRLLTAKNSRVAMFFAQWDMIFGVVYGQEIERGEAAANELANLYQIADKPDLKKLLFAIHTYYVLLMKLLAAELISLQEGSWFASFTGDIEAASDEIVREKIEYLENGGLFAQFNIVNFLEGDFFRWYLDVWDSDLARDVRHIAIALQQFEPATATIDPDATRDLLKKLYQYLLPRRVRHDLGEYYTPDWLAERLINQTGYDGNPDKRVLDPGCGSGTFLALCIRRAFDYADRNLVRPDELVAKLLGNVVGFDLNPLAVIAARTNYLLALGTLIRHTPHIEIPVYFCDSIITPSEYTEELFAHSSAAAGTTKIGDREVETAKGSFSFPGEVTEKEKIESVCALIEESVRLDRSRTQFVEKLHSKIKNLSEHAEKLLARVFERIAKLNKDGENGIWARFLKNQFAPVFVGKNTFDFIIGNPPWVNWENLSDSYRVKTRRLWEDCGLFSLTGHAARLGGGKKDLAMLFTYLSIDNYLRNGGRLGFIITQTLFKSKGAGDGFRRFRLGNREHFHVQQVDDLTDFQPFEGATNRTAVVTFEKGKKTKYPTPYLFWRKKEGERITLDDDLVDVLEKIEGKQWVAEPVDIAEPTSPWITARRKAIDAMRKAIGQSVYRAYAGSCTWANGIYWLELGTTNKAGHVIAHNLHDIGQRENIRSVETALEPNLIFPLLRGRNVERWRADSSAYLLNVQDAAKRRGIDEEFLKDELPLTYGYLRQFEDLLRQRSGFRKYFCKQVGKGAQRRLVPFAPFYSIYNVGEYTLAPFKVCWREQAEFFTCAVAGQATVIDEQKVVIPDHKLMFVPVENATEAHYLCAMLNSSTAVLIVKSYGVETQTSTHVLEHVRVPQFNSADEHHQRLANLGARAHELAREASEASGEALKNLEADVDQLAANVWNVTDAEFRDIQFSLADLK